MHNPTISRSRLRSPLSLFAKTGGSRAQPMFFNQGYLLTEWAFDLNLGHQNLADKNEDFT
ncbi:hypothetical protein NJ56_13570 [Yersinia ruckeri]|nr:hypothetical protein NJ56_13570 [Yersinia ruckeri]OIX31039.1 hypothetical protein AXW19_06685 [Yersinia ruckeri]